MSKKKAQDKKVIVSLSCLDIKPRLLEWRPPPTDGFPLLESQSCIRCSWVTLEGHSCQAPGRSAGRRSQQPPSWHRAHEAWGGLHGRASPERGSCAARPSVPPGRLQEKAFRSSTSWRGLPVTSCCGASFFTFTCSGQGGSIFYWQSSFSLWPACHRKGLC